MCLFHFNYSVILPVIIIHSSQLKKQQDFLLSLCILVPLSLPSQPPTYIPLLLRWHYPTHQTCNFNRGWQGDLDDRCSYGNRWHWQTREAAVCRLCATCAWSDWVHQLSRLPHPLHSQSDGLAQKVCCVNDNRQGASEEAVRWEGFLLFLFYLPHHKSPPSLTHILNDFSESKRLNWFYQWEFTIWPLKRAAMRMAYTKRSQYCYCSIHSSVILLSEDSATWESHSRNRHRMCNLVSSYLQFDFSCHMLIPPLVLISPFASLCSAWRK